MASHTSNGMPTNIYNKKLILNKMKINNPFKFIHKKITDSKEKNELRETERMVNHDVYVGNDPNDPENCIYIFLSLIHI